jgi:hypothetical protein
MMKSPVLAIDEIVNMELPLFVTVRRNNARPDVGSEPTFNGSQQRRSVITGHSGLWQ